MKLDLREKKGVAILDMKGPLTLGGGERALQEAVDTLVASGRTQILLNLSGSWKDTRSSDQIVRELKKARKKSTKLAKGF